MVDDVKASESVSSTELILPKLSSMELESLKAGRTSSKRELSPVLSNTNLHKKSIHDRKRCRSRVQLAKRFKSSPSCSTDSDKIDDVPQNEDYFNKALTELQIFKSKSVSDRLIKIRELDNEKKKFVDNFYVPKVDDSNQICEQKLYVISIKEESGKSNEDIKCNKLEDYDVSNYDIPKTDNYNKISNKKLKGFCTGSGKDIVISPDNFKKPSELFGDMYNINEDVLRDLCKRNKQNASSDSSPTLHPRKDISFLQTSITDTQLLLAADVALSSLNDLDKNKSFGTVHNMEIEGTKTNSELQLGKLFFNGFEFNDYNLAQTRYFFFQNFLEAMEDTVNKDEHSNKRLKLDDSCSVSHDIFKPMVSVPTLDNVELANEVPSTTKNSTDFLTITDSVINNEVPNSILTKKLKSTNSFSNGVSVCDSPITTNISESPLKNLQNIFDRDCESENQIKRKELENPENAEPISRSFQQLDSGFSTVGFQTASNKPIKMPSSAPKKAKNIFDQVCELENEQSEDNISGFKEILLESTNNICNNFSTFGFQTASKKPIKMSSSSLKKAQRIFNQICESEDNQSALKEKEESGKTTNNFNCGFQTASNKPIKMSSSSLKKAQNIFNQICESENNQVDFKENKKPDKIINNFNLITSNNNATTACGFKTASDKPIKMSSSSLQRAESIFNDVYSVENNKIGITNDFEKNSNNFLTGFALASGKNINISEKSWNKAKTLLNDENLNDFNEFKENENGNNLISTGFSSAGGKNIKISNGTWTKATAIFDNVDLTVTTVKDGYKMDVDVSNYKTKENADEICEGFTTGAGTKIKINRDSLNKGIDLFADEELFLNMDVDEVKNLSTDFSHRSKQVVFDDTVDENIQYKKIDKSEGINTNRISTEKKILHQSAKKSLGMSRCKPLLVSNEKLKRAESIFEDCQDNKSNQNIGEFQSINSNNVPLKFNPPQIHTSTPLKSVPNKIKNTALETIRENPLINTNITPVKHFTFKETLEYKNTESNNSVVIQEQTKGGLEDWVEKIDKEFEELQNRMKMLLERKKALQKQKQVIESADDQFRRPKLGVLLSKKGSSHKISLKELVHNRMPNTISVFEAVELHVSKSVLDVIPNNAQNIHFNCKSSSVVNTIDGAIIIPNSDNFVGISEIKVAFESMQGVDPKLLPNGWISNHFKWIVWKLASLERNFPDILSGCLSLENVIQQLKYRYDREIDRAERPALRRILEKDDVPQKRMVLCVSDIIKVSDHSFELELTDGWYAIHTLIDQPLCKQIFTSKIKIGTKLMIQCAEILNCEGCHPLDIPNHVKLKINYNCTRRAHWNSKLGYQRFAAPFSIKLKTIHPDGGLVACVKIQIVRVYPLRYMERHEMKTVWRNKRAEEKRALEWENQKLKDVEMIRQKVQNDYEKEIRVGKDYLLSENGNCNIKDICSPKLLYEMLENTNDPEGLKSMLSSSQISAAMEYRANMFNYRQQEITNRISEQIKKLKCTQRDVVSILRLRVVDITESSSGSFFLSIWRPTEDHLQLLKEEFAFTVYNVLSKQNNNLTTTARTHFKRETNLMKETKKMQRQLLSISKLHQGCKLLFNEYDTVGTVVQIYRKSHCQELWLTDGKGRLLLIKIMERSELCCLLDNISRGQNVAVMNLVHSQLQDTFGQAIANQYTIITSYPQHKFLQDGLATYCEQLPKDLTLILNECDKKIDSCIANMQFSKNCVPSFAGSPSSSDVFDDSSEDNTLIPSRLTTTDVAMSLIDI